MARVFVVQYSDRFDFRPLEKIGEVIFLIKRKVAPFDTHILIPMLRKALEDHQFDPETDYIACTGPNVLLNILTATVAATYKRFSFALWEAPTQSYIIRDMNLEDVEQLGGNG